MVLVELLLLRLLLWLILILLLKEKNKETKKRASKPFFFVICLIVFSGFYKLIELSHLINGNYLKRARRRFPEMIIN